MAEPPVPPFEVPPPPWPAPWPPLPPTVLTCTEVVLAGAVVVWTEPQPPAGDHDWVLVTGGAAEVVVVVGAAVVVVVVGPAVVLVVGPEVVDVVSYPAPVE